MMNKLIELLKVNSIITLLVFVTFAILMILGMIATYYFTKPENK